jgi:predicted ATPase
MKITKMQEVSSSNRSVKMVIFGGFGIGKTSLLKTLEELTLCLDFEAGLLSVQDWNDAEGPPPDVLAVQS